MNITIIENWIQEALSKDQTGHDWEHILRVRRNSLIIATSEGADIAFVSLLSIVHEVGDDKVWNNPEQAEEELRAVFQSANVSPSITEVIITSIPMISFSNRHQYEQKTLPLEVQIVQDADRLDAIGAIGIARTFAYGAVKNRKMYDNTVQFAVDRTKEEYRGSDAPTFHHFFEKLLRIKEMLNTKTAKKMAHHRHELMENFVKQFEHEWTGNE
ncbi:MAG: HD domain-containing protein [Bacilli bacterium]